MDWIGMIWNTFLAVVAVYLIWVFGLMAYYGIRFIAKTASDWFYNGRP